MTIAEIIEFKTPKKVGVGGSFPNVTYTGKRATAETVKTLIREASVTIDGGKVETKTAKPKAEKKVEKKK